MMQSDSNAKTCLRLGAGARACSLGDGDVVSMLRPHYRYPRRALAASLFEISPRLAQHHTGGGVGCL